MRKSVKSFGQFLTEGKNCSINRKLKMKGLKGDGHGGWYDAKGNFKAKTVNGKLVFTGGGGAKPPEDPNSTKVATPQAPPPQNQKHHSCTSNARARTAHQRKVVSLQR